MFAALVFFLAMQATPDLSGPFVGDWTQWPNHVMTEADRAEYDPCARPMRIERLGEDRIQVTRWPRTVRRMTVSRHGQDYLWQPVDRGQPHLARITSDGELLIPLETGLDPDWSIAQRARRCPVVEAER